MNIDDFIVKKLIETSGKSMTSKISEKSDKLIANLSAEIYREVQTIQNQDEYKQIILDMTKGSIQN